MASKRPRMTGIHENQPSPQWRRQFPPPPTPIIGPANLDQRFTVRELPADYQSVLDSSECRGWARAVAGGKP